MVQHSFSVKKYRQNERSRTINENKFHEFFQYFLVGDMLAVIQVIKRQY